MILYKLLHGDITNTIWLITLPCKTNLKKWSHELSGVMNTHKRYLGKVQVFKCDIAFYMCDGLKKNVPHRLRCLNNWAPVSSSA